jgi:hypothetical protein
LIEPLDLLLKNPRVCPGNQPDHGRSSTSEGARALARFISQTHPNFVLAG